MSTLIVGGGCRRLRAAPLKAEAVTEQPLGQRQDRDAVTSRCRLKPDLLANAGAFEDLTEVRAPAGLTVLAAAEPAEEFAPRNLLLPRCVEFARPDVFIAGADHIAPGCEDRVCRIVTLHRLHQGLKQVMTEAPVIVEVGLLRLLEDRKVDQGPDDGIGGVEPFVLMPAGGECDARLSEGAE